MTAFEEVADALGNALDLDGREPLRVYVGGARAELPRVEAFIARVKAAGHTITHDWTVFARAMQDAPRWTDGSNGPSRYTHEPPMMHDERFTAWKASLDGISDADACIFLAPRTGVTRGMWAELGACQAEGNSECIYVGHDDDTIATSMCTVVADDDAAFAALEAM